jgi:tetratricopeptide (TPR) repeat protein
VYIRLTFQLLTCVALFLLVSEAGISVRAQGIVTRQDSPLSHDARNPNSYDLENELRNSKAGKEVEIALEAGNKAFSAKPPRYATAEQSYLRAAKLEPKEARAYLGLGRLYAAQNQVEKTIESFKKAVEVKPKYAEAHFNLGLVYHAIGKKEEAIKEYDALVLLDKPLAKKLNYLIGN